MDPIAKSSAGKPPFNWPAALLACVLLVDCTLAFAEPLGRLFFTPERRAALDRQRQMNVLDYQSQALESLNLSVNGVVTGSSGKVTTWVNGIPQQDASLTGVRVEPDRKIPGKTTVLIGEEAPVSIKVGETINRATHETSSGVGGGRIVVKQSAAAPDKGR